MFIFFQNVTRQNHCASIRWRHVYRFNTFEKKNKFKKLAQKFRFFKMSEQNNQTEVPTQENEELKAELIKLEDEINTLKQVSIKCHLTKILIIS